MWEGLLIALAVGAAVLAGLVLLQRMEFRSVFPRRRKRPGETVLPEATRRDDAPP
jgi:hypothetical protein